MPEKLCVIGIDNEEGLTRYLSRVALSLRRAGGAANGKLSGGETAAPLLAREEMPLQRILVPPVRVIARRSTNYRSLTDPAVIRAMRTLFVTMPVGH